MKTYAGLDLHGDNVYCGVADEEDRRLFEKRLPCDVKVISQVLAPYRETLQAVVVESTFNWYWLVDGLQADGYPMQLANPGGFAVYQGLKHGDDKSDSFFLAHLSRLGILPTGYIYPKADRAIRDLLRRRQRWVQIRTGQVLALQGMLARHTGMSFSGDRIKALSADELKELLADEHVQLAGMSLREHIVYLGGQVATLEKEVLTHTESTRSYEGLCRVPGIGKVLAMTISLETGDIRRFPSPGHYASYCRTVRSEWSSNGKKKGEGNTKNGNKYLAWAYVEAANFMARYCPEARGYFQRKLARAPRVVAVKSLAAKLAKACYFILRDGVEFDVKKMFG